jgi:hypothetical protein
MPPKAAKGSDSKQGLVIGLICFVLLALILGVTTYTGYAEAGKLDDARKKAEDGEKKAKDLGKWYKYQALLLKAYAGHSSKEDLSDLGVLRGESGTLGQGEKDKAEMEKLAQQLDDARILGLGWDATQNKPARTYKGEVDRLKQELGAAQLALNKSEADLQAARRTYQENVDGLTNAMSKWKAEFDKAQKLNVDYTQQKTKEYQDALNQIADLSDKNEKLTKQLDQFKDEHVKSDGKLKQEIIDQQNRIVRISQQLPQTSVIDYDAPKGKIVQLDLLGKTAYLNLGRVENVKPQLTFSISGVGPGGKSNRQRKGTLEVVKVMGDHLCEARVTDVVDPNRDPIMKDDLVFNPIWTPYQQEHVAITGLIDFTGDGQDRTADLIRILEGQGVVVDAYLDLKDLTIKGKGMTLQTTYLIRGGDPDFGNQLQIVANDPRVARKSDIMAKIGEMQTEANRLGVAVVPLRRFVTLTGLRLPRAVNRQAYDLGSLRLGENKEPAKKEDKPEAKEEKPKEVTGK